MHEDRTTRSISLDVCWRDFKKHVVGTAGWSASRRAATEQEKKDHGSRLKGRVYFVDVTYKLPPKPKKSKKRAAADVEDGNAKRAKGNGGAASSSAAF